MNARMLLFRLAASWNDLATEFMHIEMVAKSNQSVFLTQELERAAEKWYMQRKIKWDIK